MTREEAKLLLNDNDERETGYSGSIEYQDECIDKIYDDFEARTCENCKQCVLEDEDIKIPKSQGKGSEPVVFTVPVSELW